MTLVLPEYRPTLRDELARLPRAVGWVVAGLLALLGAGLLALLLKPGDDGVDYVQRAPIEFNFRHGEGFDRAPRDGDTFVRLVRRREDALFLDSFAVAALALPAYEGDVGGLLPVLAEGEIAALRRTYREFELTEEGKARINEVPGYSVGFRARTGRRRLYGRVVLLPEPVPNPRRGVRLVMLSTPAAGVSKASDIGSRGPTKTPYRTFRFGTEKP